MISNYEQDGAFETIIGHDGKPVRVKEGHALRVNMMMRGSLSPVQRAIPEDQVGGNEYAKTARRQGQTPAAGR